MNSARVELNIRRLKWHLAAYDVELKFREFGRKAGFNPDQPRHPKGSPDGGRWSGDGTSPGIGHNQGPPLEAAPEIPETQPASRRDVNNFLKAAARWLFSATRISGPAAASFVAAYEALSWLDTDRMFIEAYQDPPKALEELQLTASEPKWGYDIHHIVEQTPARQGGFSESQIEGPENLVRIPTLKHWEITGWYGTPNRDFNGLSPRDYLRDKEWIERVRVGHSALIKYGVLKP